MNFYLYQYTHKISGKSYIGTTMNLERRQREHTRSASCARAFNRAVNKYSIEAFSFRVLAILDNAGEAARTEQAAIMAFGTLAHNGYNLNGGAPFTKYQGPTSEETRAKQSAIAIGRASPNKGKKFSPEYCQKLSDSHRIEVLSPKSRKNMSDGQRNSEKCHQKIDKLHAAFRGKKHTSEHCQKISSALKGKPRSPETCQKISDAAKLREAKKRENKANKNITEAMYGT